LPAFLKPSPPRTHPRYINAGRSCCWCGRLEVNRKWLDLGLPAGVIWREYEHEGVKFVIAPQHGICPECSAKMGVKQ
jgi:hypothetical protein